MTVGQQHLQASHFKCLICILCINGAMIITIFQIRLSVGLEDTEDLIEDLDKALKEAVSGVMLQTIFKLTVKYMQSSLRLTKKNTI